MNRFTAAKEALKNGGSTRYLHDPAIVEALEMAERSKIKGIVMGWIALMTLIALAIIFLTRLEIIMQIDSVPLDCIWPYNQVENLKQIVNEK